MVEVLLSVHAFVPATRANGPGVRAAIWLQGCTLACPGCFNPETHPRASGFLVPVSEVVARIDALGETIEGVSITGGEPLQQWDAVKALLEELCQRPSLSVVLFSGFGYHEIARMGRLPELMHGVDVLVAGRYRREQHLARGLRGSSNKTLHLFSNRYSTADIEGVPVSEVLIDPSGNVVVTGMEPLQW